MGKIEWATDANFPAGSEDWSGMATKAEPSASAKQTGFIPTEPVPAEYLNWLLGKVTERMNALDASRGRPVLVPSMDDFGDVVGVATFPHLGVKFGVRAGTVSNYRSRAGLDFTIDVALLNLAFPLGIEVDEVNQNVFVWGNHTGTVPAYNYDRDPISSGPTVWAKNTLGTGTESPTEARGFVFCHNRANDQGILITDTVDYYTIDSNAATVLDTARVLPFTSATREARAIATDGTRTCVVFRSADSATAGAIAYTDDGINWTTATGFTGSTDTFADVSIAHAHHGGPDGTGLWLAYDSSVLSGAFFTSTDGATWTQVSADSTANWVHPFDFDTGAPVGTVNRGNNKPRGLVSDGVRFFIAFNDASYNFGFIYETVDGVNFRMLADYHWDTNAGADPLGDYDHPLVVDKHSNRVYLPNPKRTAAAPCLVMPSADWF